MQNRMRKVTYASIFRPVKLIRTSQPGFEPEHTQSKCVALPITLLAHNHFLFLKAELKNIIISHIPVAPAKEKSSEKHNVINQTNRHVIAQLMKSTSKNNKHPILHLKQLSVSQNIGTLCWIKS